MQRDFISYYGNRSRSEVYRKNPVDFLKLFFSICLVVFKSHHIRCSDQAVPKSMLRREEVVVSKNSDLSRRQEISVTAEEAVPSGRCWNDWLLGNIAGWGPFSENRWNYLVTRNFAFLHKSLMAYKESTQLKYAEVCLSFYVGKDTSTDEYI